MVWLVEKKIIQHTLDCGFERVKIPIRIKFEFEVKEGVFVQDSMSVNILYNRQAIENRYPECKSEELEKAVDTTVKEEIRNYMKECGWGG